MCCSAAVRIRYPGPKRIVIIMITLWTSFYVFDVTSAKKGVPYVVLVPISLQISGMYTWTYDFQGFVVPTTGKCEYFCMNKMLILTWRRSHFWPKLQNFIHEHERIKENSILANLPLCSILCKKWSNAMNAHEIFIRIVYH